MIMLSVIDGLWKDHLLNMDHLKEGIGLRGYAQQDPLVAYKKESFEMFEEMMARFQEDTVRFLFLMKIVGPDGQPVEIADAAAAGRFRRRRMWRQRMGTGIERRVRRRSPLQRRARHRRPSTKSRRNSSGRSKRSWSTRGWRAAATLQRRNSAARGKKLGATILAPAGQGRSTRSATARKARAQGTGHRNPVLMNAVHSCRHAILVCARK